MLVMTRVTGKAYRYLGLTLKLMTGRMGRLFLRVTRTILMARRPAARRIQVPVQDGVLGASPRVAE